MSAGIQNSALSLANQLDIRLPDMAGRGLAGIACSGGADSVCLLLVTWARYPDWREHLHVLHFNHGMRGADSDADALFVKNLAKSLGLHYRVEKAESFSTAANEAELRNARMAFYEKSGCKLILQGHQADDVLETQLMRLARGSGAEGLAAPRPLHRHKSGITFYRPLLGFSRTYLREALLSHGIEWREDASNCADVYLRNRIRHHVVPELEKVTGRDVLRGALQTREQLEEDAGALAGMVDELFGDLHHCDTLYFSSKKIPRAVVRRAVQRWLAGRKCAPLSPTNMSELLHAVETGETFKFSHDGHTFDFDEGVLRLLEQVLMETGGPDAVLVENSSVYFPDGRTVSLAAVNLTAQQRRDILRGRVEAQTEAFLDLDATPLSVRYWREGDRYRALGSPGSRKLQDMFTDAKIPQRERHRLPLVTLGDDIIWIPGFSPAEAYKITEDTKQALWLTCGRI